MSEETIRDAVERAKAVFEESAALKSQLANGDAPAILAKMAGIAADSIRGGGKVMLCGNGGSAADAQHIAAEMVVRLRGDRDRDALPALSLALDMSSVTACANDYGYAHLFDRPLQAIGRKGDILIGLSTSGNSQNVTAAMLTAREMGVTVFGFLGGKGGKAMSLCHECFLVPSKDPGRVQESHITAGHILVELIEDALGVV
ncbi:MAG: SIS domain-containing protein [Alphaproteobacteria bacterium]|nr:SIS domain-containing protein [Alphaproteobacteria bacterium]MBF0251171.1 SIS domain-containing protein [Alphaproteobacteria bacterium]